MWLAETFLHSLYIKRNMYLKNLANLIWRSRATLTCNDNGWSNNEIGFEWLKHFNKYTRPVGSHRLLIFNKYSSQATFAFTQYAKENNIILFYLPPHATYRFQLLNITIFGPLLIYYSELVHKESKYNEKNITKCE